MTLSLNKLLSTRIEWMHPGYKYLYGSCLGILIALTSITWAPLILPLIKSLGLTPLSSFALVLPPLILFLLYRERTSSPDATPAETRDPIERFKQLAALKAENLITDLEYQHKRDEILRDL